MIVVVVTPFQFAQQDLLFGVQTRGMNIHALIGVLEGPLTGLSGPDQTGRRIFVLLVTVVVVTKGN